MKSNKPRVSLKDALRMGFSQVMGMPGVCYARGGRFYDAAMREVGGDDAATDSVVIEPASPAPVDAPMSIGGLDLEVVAYRFGEQSFTNGALVLVAYEQSGMTKAEWNAQNDGQIAARVSELIDDMKAAEGADAVADSVDPAAVAQGPAAVDLEAMRKAMDDAHAALDAIDQSIPENRGAVTNAKRAYTRAKNAYESAAGLTA